MNSHQPESSNVNSFKQNFLPKTNRFSPTSIQSQKLLNSLSEPSTSNIEDNSDDIIEVYANIQPSNLNEPTIILKSCSLLNPNIYFLEIELITLKVQLEKVFF